MAKKRKESKHLEKFVLEFPVLVYKDDKDWVAQCLLTSTIAVCDNPRDTRRFVSCLLETSSTHLRPLAGSGGLAPTPTAE